MTWIFGSFLVTPCALTSCQVLISKQRNDSASGQSGPTGVKPEGDHVITTWSDLDRVQRIESRARDTQPTRSVRSSLTIRIARGCKRWHPWLPEEDMEQEELPSLSICLPIYLSINNKLWAPLEIKMRDTFL